jgi:hypothetical protein
MTTAREDDDRNAGARTEDEVEAVDQVVEEVRDEIRHGHVDEDVSHLLEDRLHEAGVDLRPETVDDLAEHIENDVST